MIQCEEVKVVRLRSSQKQSHWGKKPLLRVYKKPTGHVERLWDDPPPYRTQQALSNDTLTFEVKVTIRGQGHFKGKT